MRLHGIDQGSGNTPGGHLELLVTPANLRTEFLPLLALGEERSFAQLAAGIGSRDTKPKRALEKYHTTAQLFGLAKVSLTGVTLTGRGLRFLAGPAGGGVSRAAVRAAFFETNIPKQLLDTLSTTPTFTRGEALRRLGIFSRADELDLWIEWLAYAGLVKQEDGGVFKLDAPTRAPLEIYAPLELYALEEERYRVLVMADYATTAPGASLSYQALIEAIGAFKNAPPDKAEKHLKRVALTALAAVGIISQVQNGPRESNRVTANFGVEGEDAVGFFLRPPMLLAESSCGLAIVMELKRTASDKKAVVQALGASGRWRTFFDGKARVIPLTISDSDGYAERSARDYALTNGVIHMPMEALTRLAALQKECFESGKPLITPVHFWTMLEEFVSSSYIEPTAEDVITAMINLLSIPESSQLSTD